MSLAQHYRQLGLRTGASYQDVKLAYRNLARLYHPDINPDDQEAKEKFIQVTQAYRALASDLQVQGTGAANYPSSATAAQVSTAASQPVEVARTVGDNVDALSSASRKKQGTPTPEVGTSADSQSSRELKQQFFAQLCGFLEQGRFPRAIALVEGLLQRLPGDPEVGQWYATTYYRWGRDLVNQQQYKKAEACLKKAMRADPHNQSLQRAIQRELLRLGDALSAAAGSYGGNGSKAS